MRLFKNKVGRPSNETLRRRRKTYFIIAILVISIIGGGVFYVKNNFLSKINGTGKNAQTSKGNGDVATDESYLEPDGKITNVDANLVLKFSVNAKTSTTIQKKRADVDGDGKITSGDSRIISRLALDGKNPCGDINKDGKHTQADVDMIIAFSMGTKTPTEEQKERADVDGDGKITSVNSPKGKKTITDAMILYNFVHNGIGDVATSVDYSKKDGRVTKSDAEAILKFAVGNLTPTAVQKKAADVDGNGSITVDDAKLVLKKANEEDDIVEAVTVTYNKNGADSLLKTSTTCKISTDINKRNCEVTLPTIQAKSGFTVLGWSTNKSATSATYKANQKVKVSKNMTYYAITRSQDYIVATFKINNAKNITTKYSSCYKYNGATNCEVRTPSITAKDGYVARGWSKDSTWSDSKDPQNKNKLLMNQPIKISNSKDAIYYAVTTKRALDTLYEIKVEDMHEDGKNVVTLKEVKKYLNTYPDNVNNDYSMTRMYVKSATDGTTVKKYVEFSSYDSKTQETKNKKMRIDVDLTSSSNKKHITSKDKIVKLEKKNNSENDYRIILDYMYAKGNWQAHLNDTIQIYVKTLENNGKVYGPYGVDDYKFNGNYVYTGPNDNTKTLLYSYEIISERLSSELYGKTITRIVIEPYNYINATRSFILNGFSIVRYNSIKYNGHTKADSYYTSSYDKNATRVKIVNSMYDYAGIKWELPSNVKAEYGNISNHTKNHELEFLSGEVYYGVPYGGGNQATIESFTNKLSKTTGNKLVYVGEHQTKKVDSLNKSETENKSYWLENANLKALRLSCSTSVGTAIGSSIPLNMSLYEPHQWLYANYEFDYLGNINVKVGNKSYSLNDYIHYKDKDVTTSVSNPDPRGTSSKLIAKIESDNQLEKLYEAYAMAKPGDVTSMYNKGGDKSDTSAHHIRLVSGISAHVVCKKDKNGKKAGEEGFTPIVMVTKDSDGYGLKWPTGCRNYGGIDPQRSYLILTDITSSIRYCVNKDDKGNCLSNSKWELYSSNKLRFTSNDSLYVKPDNKKRYLWSSEKGYYESSSGTIVKYKGGYYVASKPDEKGYVNLDSKYIFLDKNGNLTDSAIKESNPGSMRSAGDLSSYMIADPNYVISWTPNSKYTDLKSLYDFNNTYGNWAINHIHTFEELREQGYFAVTMKQYKKTTITDPYAYIIDPNTNIQDVINKGIIGTIRSNNEIKQIKYEITLNSNKKETIIEYPNYNLIEGVEKNIYSFYWRQNKDIRTYLNKKYTGSKFYDDVLVYDESSPNGRKPKNSDFSLIDHIAYMHKTDTIKQFKISVVAGGKTITVLNLYD